MKGAKLSYNSSHSLIFCAADIGLQHVDNGFFRCMVPAAMLKIPLTLLQFFAPVFSSIWATKLLQSIA
jgi:hypothetical protein